MLVIYALIGNDVCDGTPGDKDWTTVAEFQANVLRALDFLHATLPPGSHVAFLGLADGRVLYDTTHTHQHPIGVTYPEVYDFLSCNLCNPCWGWLNTNETWRNATSERAAELSNVYSLILAANATRYADVFDMHVLQVDWRSIFTEYTAQGGNIFDLIEPADGFHPSQTGNMLLAEKVWDDLATNKPDWLPPTNPNNGRIAQLFGDQGGY
jgi:acyloxyacyl hydrolase